jgi:hypothetical protein
MQEYIENDFFVSELRKLENQGYRGKSLINILISDDWGAPPASVNIKGKLADGSVIDESIRYE